MITSEYVTIGHPDKIADYISEYILDRYLEKDNTTRYALEVQIKDNFVSLAGEISSKVQFTKEQHAEFVKDAIREIGYTEEYADKWGEGNCVDPRKIEVVEHISKQSPDIAQGVDRQGWGDQGIFWGMATSNKDTNYMPIDHYYAKRIGDTLFHSKIGGLDIKTQVSIDERTNKAEKVIVAIPILESGDVYDYKVQEVVAIVKSFLPEIDEKNIIVNGTGRYVCHSSMGDAGTTGRKLAVDFYGGNCRVGGGSPWTKDPTKADLTLNLYARKKAVEYMMKCIKNGLPMEECHVQIECCIGRKEIGITYWNGDCLIGVEYYEDKSTYDIIKELNLDRPIYVELLKIGLPNYIKSVSLS